VEEFTEIFESESREIYARRHEIVKSLDLRPGMAVADVGAGTGLFMELFAEAVGVNGKLYAVEVAPKFIEHLQARARKGGLHQVEVVAGEDRSARLPSNSVDLVFLCDTYHHFEYPESMLASLHRALRPRGRLVVVDFEKIPGSSQEWVLEHVRAGRAQVSAEIADAGFVFEHQRGVDGLVENYVLEFRRP
jgi:ubiquinone/menaquinone biosynthesis C-methylase UbiE